MTGNMCLPAHIRLLRQVDDLRCVVTCSDTFVIFQYPESPPDRTLFAVFGRARHYLAWPRVWTRPIRSRWSVTVLEQHFHEACTKPWHGFQVFFNSTAHLNPLTRPVLSRSHLPDKPTMVIFKTNSDVQNANVLINHTC